VRPDRSAKRFERLAPIGQAELQVGDVAVAGQLERELRGENIAPGACVVESRDVSFERLNDLLAPERQMG